MATTKNNQVATQNDNIVFNKKHLDSILKTADGIEDNIKAGAYAAIRTGAFEVLRLKKEVEEWNAQLEIKNAPTVAENDKIKEEIQNIKDEIAEVDVSREYMVLDGLLKTKVENVQVFELAGKERYMWQDTAGGWNLISDTSYTKAQDPNEDRAEDAQAIAKCIHEAQLKVDKLAEDMAALVKTIKPLPFEKKELEVSEIVEDFTLFVSKSEIKAQLKGSYERFALIINTLTEIDKECQPTSYNDTVHNLIETSVDIAEDSLSGVGI